MKGILAGSPVFIQLLALLTGILTGAVLAGCVSLILNMIFPCNSSGSIRMLQAVLFFSQIAMFLLPALFTACLCSEHPRKFLYIQGFPEGRLLLWTVSATFLISPAISVVSYWNMQMQLPEALAPLEAWMREMEESSAEALNLLINGEGWMHLAANIVVIAVLASVTEEFIFRGALFSILRKSIRNPHVTIWLIAVIFSAIHFQFFGFLPRMLLGAYLGYLLYWTKNIWIPVTAHFLYNATAVVAMSNDSLKENPLFAEEITSGDAGWLSVTAVVCLVFFAGCVRMIYRSKSEAENH
ncbi:MAG: CPBP family intramembrane metalloprotease [Tannerella sp.]|nr:CPBP family intramembrane metalloprotease [Tannerella sp.]